MVTNERASVGWGLWLQLMLASAVGGIVVVVVGSYELGEAVGETLGGVVGGAVGTALIGGVLLGGVMGAIGIAQWLILRSQVSWAGWWLLAMVVGGTVGGAVGGGVGGALAVALAGFGMEPLGGVVGLGVILTVFGITQWLILRQQVSRAGWLVLASVVGLGVGLGVYGALSGPAGWLLGVVVSGAGLGAVYGAITGGALVWLLHQPVPKAEAGGDHDLNQSNKTLE